MAPGTAVDLSSFSLKVRIPQTMRSEEPLFLRSRDLVEGISEIILAVVAEPPPEQDRPLPTRRR